ncbi:unnamed protein product [Prorocentrum cordatum]|nr:unnamed protein product [Polarella glacialis]
MPARGEGSAPPAPLETLEGVRAYLEDEDFLLEVACWAWEHCTKFPYEPPNKWEHPLEFTRLHGEYRELFEGRVDEFLEQEGIDLKTVLDSVHAALRENPGEMRALVDSLAASEDYLAFCRYMQQVRLRRDWAEGKDLGPPPEEPEGASASSGRRQPASGATALQKVPEEEPGDLEALG